MTKLSKTLLSVSMFALCSPLLFLGMYQGLKAGNRKVIKYRGVKVVERAKCPNCKASKKHWEYVLFDTSDLDNFRNIYECRKCHKVFYEKYDMHDWR